MLSNSASRWPAGWCLLGWRHEAPPGLGGLELEQAGPDPPIVVSFRDGPVLYLVRIVHLPHPAYAPLLAALDAQTGSLSPLEPPGHAGRPLPGSGRP